MYTPNGGNAVLPRIATNLSVSRATHHCHVLFTQDSSSLSAACNHIHYMYQHIHYWKAGANLRHNYAVTASTWHTVYMSTQCRWAMKSYLTTVISRVDRPKQTYGLCKTGGCVHGKLSMSHNSGWMPWGTKYGKSNCSCCYCRPFPVMLTLEKPLTVARWCM